MPMITLHRFIKPSCFVSPYSPRKASCTGGSKLSQIVGSTNGFRFFELHFFMPFMRFNWSALALPLPVAAVDALSSFRTSRFSSWASRVRALWLVSSS